MSSMRLHSKLFFTLAVFIVFLFGCSVTPKKPIPSFTISPETGSILSTFSFNASASEAGEGTISSYSWNFGDSSTGEGETVTHQYQTAGTYTVTLAVTNSKDQSASISKNVIVIGTGTVSGYVVNRNAGTAVAGSTVKALGSDITTATDSNGFYSMVVPEGYLSLTFDKDGHAQSRVDGLRVQAGQTSHYDTIQPVDFDSSIANIAPTLSLNLNHGDSVTGDGSNSFSVVVNGTSNDPSVKFLYGITAGLMHSRGLSAFWDGQSGVAHADFPANGGAYNLSLSADGFSGEASLHISVYDQGLNRAEIIRYINIQSTRTGATPIAPEISGIAVTWGDVSYSSFPYTLPDAKTSLNVIEAFSQAKGDFFKEAIEAMKPQNKLSSSAITVNPTGSTILDEVLTWVNIDISYAIEVIDDAPEAFEIYRKSANDADFRLLARIPAIVQVDADEDGNPIFDINGFYQDATPSVRADMEMSYRVDAVSGSERASSNVFTTTPLGAFYVTAERPASQATDVSVVPTYIASFANANNLIHYAPYVWDIVHANNAIIWGYSFRPFSARDSFAIAHDFNGDVPLEPYHAYSWVPYAMTSNGVLGEDGRLVAGSISAVSIASDAGVFGFNHPVYGGVSDTSPNTFLTGNGTF
ncbi:MAG: PKD domain-containing protein [Deinococcales bacterium]